MCRWNDEDGQPNEKTRQRGVHETPTMSRFHAWCKSTPAVLERNETEKMKGKGIRRTGPCSFCGNVYAGDNQFNEMYGYHEVKFAVQCKFCGAQGPWKGTKDAAVKAWNRQIITRESLTAAYNLGVEDTKKKYAAEKQKKEDLLLELVSLAEKVRL